MAQRRKFSAEYNLEAVAMLDAPGVSVGQCYKITVKGRAYGVRVLIRHA